MSKYSDFEIIELSRKIIHEIEPIIRKYYIPHLDFPLYIFNHDNILEIYHCKREQCKSIDLNIEEYLRFILNQWISYFYLEQMNSIFLRINEAF